MNQFRNHVWNGHIQNAHSQHQKTTILCLLDHPIVQTAEPHNHDHIHYHERTLARFAE